MIKKTAMILSVGLLALLPLNDVYANSNYQKNLIKGSNQQISLKLNKSVFKKSDEAILINENASIDAISATPLAYSKDAPIITTEWKDLDKKTKDYIKDLGVKEIIIVGGLKNVSKTTELELIKMGIKVKRIYGDDRYETAIKIAKEMSKQKKVTDVIFMSSTSGLENAISIAEYACKNNMPILWGKDDKLKGVIDFINKQNYNKVYAIGDSERFTYDVEHEVKNAKMIKEINKYETNIDLIKKIDNNNTKEIYTVNMDYGNYADITAYLSLPVVAAKQDIPILVCNENLTYSQQQFLNKNVQNVIQVGQTVGSYSIINTLTTKSFIRVVVLIILLIIIAIRALKS